MHSQWSSSQLSNETLETPNPLWGKVHARFIEYIDMDSAQISKRWQYLGLCCIVLIGLAARVKPMQIPQLDRTMWKEIDYIEISRNYAAHGMHFLEPEITWPAEPPRITAMEFRAVPYAAAALYKALGFQVGAVRLIPLMAFLIMPVYLFFLVRDEMAPLPALTTSLVATLMPIHHPFGLVLFSEPVSITMSVAALFHFNRWAKYGQFRHAVGAMLALTLAVAVKLEPLFMLLPLAYLWWRYRRAGRTTVFFPLFVAASLTLPLSWFLYAYHLSRTSIDVFGIVPFLRGHNKLQTLTLTRDYHFWLTLGHRIWTLGWGLLGLPFQAIGLIVAMQEKRARLFLVYSVTIAIYFVIVAEGQLDAPYRQLNAVPVLSFFTAVGILALISVLFDRMKLSSERNIKLLIAITVAVVLIAFLPSYWETLREDPNEPSHPRTWALAQQIRSHSVAGDCLVALGEYTAHEGGNDVSPVLYYYSGRQGWTLSEDQLSEQRLDALIRKHATLLAVDDEFVFSRGIRNEHTRVFIENLTKKFPILYRSGDALLLRLSPSPAIAGTLGS